MLAGAEITREARDCGGIGARFEPEAGREGRNQDGALRGDA